VADKTIIIFYITVKSNYFALSRVQLKRSIQQIIIGVVKPLHKLLLLEGRNLGPLGEEENLSAKVDLHCVIAISEIC
jgi:hypothetical protein